MHVHSTNESDSGSLWRHDPAVSNDDAPSPSVEDIAAEKWLPEPVKESKLALRLAQLGCVLLTALLAGLIFYMARNRWPDAELLSRCNDPNYHAAECKGVHGRSAERNYTQ